MVHFPVQHLSATPATALSRFLLSENREIESSSHSSKVGVSTIVDDGAGFKFDAAAYLVYRV